MLLSFLAVQRLMASRRRGGAAPPGGRRGGGLRQGGVAGQACSRLRIRAGRASSEPACCAAQAAKRRGVEAAKRRGRWVSSPGGAAAGRRPRIWARDPCGVVLQQPERLRRACQQPERPGRRPHALEPRSPSRPPSSPRQSLRGSSLAKHQQAARMQAASQQEALPLARRRRLARLA